MKILKKLIAISLIISSLGLFAQVSHNDVIYSNVSNDTISDCNIIGVDRNVVVFESKGTKKKIIAKAIEINGNYIDLRIFLDYKNYKPKQSELDSLKGFTYNGKQYAIYYNRYLTAEKIRKSTMIMSIASIAGAGVGQLMLINHDEIMGIDPILMLGTILKYGGLGTAVFVVPLWISSTIISKKQKKNMALCRRTNIRLGFNVNNNGVGIAVSF